MDKILQCISSATSPLSILPSAKPHVQQTIDPCPAALRQISDTGQQAHSSKPDKNAAPTLPHFPMHKLRHYFASKMSAMNIPEANIMRMGG